MRSKRSIQVIFFAVFAVVFTLYSIQSLEPKKLVNIEKKTEDYDANFAKAKESFKELKELAEQIKQGAV